MRIQHNIPAMNAYRNYNSNTKALQLNLQKLSSGYKINKAGDDAAGLAISEKMRAQITGLEVAQKNAKDGISLVQTAEGAMTEIHTMLNRMFSLAEQSANGTYDDKVDRAQLNNEFTKLKDEIDRIADATNFNGQKLLNGDITGSGSGTSGSKGGKVAAKVEVPYAANAAYSENPATPLTVEVTFGQLNSNSVATANSGEVTINWKDADGKAQTTTVTLLGGTTGQIKYKVDGGTEKATTDATNAQYNGNAINAKGAGYTVAEALKDTELGKLFDVASDNNGKLTFTAKEAGESKVSILGITDTNDVNTAANLKSSTLNPTQQGAGASSALDITNMKVYSTDATAANNKGTTNVTDVVFSVDGKKFALVNQGEAMDAQSKMGKDVNIVEVDGSAALDGTAAKALADKINEVVKYDAAAVNGTTDTQIDFKPVDKKGSSSGSSSTASTDGLRLRVGDSTESYDDIYVSIKSMKADDLADLTGDTGKVLSDLSVDDPDNADMAMNALKGMINYVSNERGNLGATQNRLDHTINNLSTMQENIQDAEATIRDVDVAEEMMRYTKNNILVQSAQAMLAQANQLPQGVLQLLG